MGVMFGFPPATGFFRLDNRGDGPGFRRRVACIRIQQAERVPEKCYSRCEDIALQELIKTKSNKQRRQQAQNIGRGLIRRRIKRVAAPSIAVMSAAQTKKTMLLGIARNRRRFSPVNNQHASRQGIYFHCLHHLTLQQFRADMGKKFRVAAPRCDPVTQPPRYVMGQPGGRIAIH